MKNVVAYLILLLETIGIIAASVIYANKASMHSAINIQVPDGMQLTLSKEIEIDTADGSIVLSEGTVVTPEYIFPHDVHFQYEGMNQRIHADWDNFKEKQQLEALKVEAEHDLEDRIQMYCYWRYNRNSLACFRRHIKPAPYQAPEGLYFSYYPWCSDCDYCF